MRLWNGGRENNWYLEFYYDCEIRQVRHSNLVLRCLDHNISILLSANSEDDTIQWVLFNKPKSDWAERPRAEAYLVPTSIRLRVVSLRIICKATPLDPTLEHPHPSSHYIHGLFFGFDLTHHVATNNGYLGTAVLPGRGPAPDIICNLVTYLGE